MSDSTDAILRLAQQYLISPAQRTAQSVYDIGTSPVRALGHPAVQKTLFGTPPGRGEPHPGALDFTPLLGITPFIRGAGGAGANATIPGVSSRFKPRQVEGIMEDIGRGRREMIAGKRIVSDDPITDVSQFGRTYTEIDPLIKQLRSARDTHAVERPPYSAGEAVYGPWSARANELHNAIMDLLNESTRRSRANLLAPHDPLSPVITERSFLDGLMRDAMHLFIGAKAPRQTTGSLTGDLTAEQRQQIGITR